MNISIKKIIKQLQKTACQIILFCLLFATSIYAQNSLVKKGDDALKLHQYSDAFDLYSRAVESDPSLENQQEFTIKRAMTAFRTGKYQAAQFLLVQAKQLGDGFTDYLDYFTAVTAWYNGEHGFSLKLLQEFTGNHPASMMKTEAIYLAGYIHHHLGNYTESNAALIPIERYREITAGRNGTRYLIGTNYIKMNRFSDGKKQLMRIITNSRSDTLALKAAEFVYDHSSETGMNIDENELLMYAAVFIQHGRVNKAVSAIEKYFREYPNGTMIGRGYFERGRLRYARRQYSRSISDFKKAFTLLKIPRLVRDSRLYIGRCKANMGDRTGANKEYDRYARSYPRDRNTPEALWLIGLNHERRNEWLKAANAYQRVADCKGSSSYIRRAKFKVGFCWFRNNYITKSSQYFNALKKRSPGSVLGMQAAFWEAKALEKLKKTDEARQIYEQLSQRTTRNYYVLTARERMNKTFAFTPGTGIVSNDGYPASLEKSIKTGFLFGEPWGSRELKQFRKQSHPDKQILVNIHNAFVDIGLFDEAIRLADLLYNRYYHNEADRTIFESLYPHYYSSLIEEIPETQRFDRALIYAIIRRESLFGYNAVSHAGACGLMQLMPATAQALAKAVKLDSFDKSDVFRPEINLRLGIRNIRDLMQRFKGNLPAAIAAYNAGDATIRGWISRYGVDDIDVFIENIEYSETYVFVKEVLKNYYFYRHLYRENAAGN